MFSKNDTVEIVTYCWSAIPNEEFASYFDSNDGFGCTSDGEMVFKVPINWLIELINNNLQKDFLSYQLEKPISNLEEFIVWKNLYAHSDGTFIFNNAKKDNVIIGTPEIIDCDFCSSKAKFN